MEDKKISCIIPAYNEAKSIRNTLSVATKINDLYEIIVVDDGSSDGTQEIIRSFPKAKMLVNEQNQGKSKSVARGIKEAKGDYIFLLDADLIGLETRNIRAMIRPIKIGEADVAIGIQGNTPSFMKKIGIDFMTGERILPKSLIARHIDEISALKNFGLEVFTNRIIIRNNLRIKTVWMDNVRNDLKFTKRGFWRGLYIELLMWRDIFKTASFFELISQNIKMRKLLVKNEEKIQKTKINFEYLRVWLEIILGFLLILTKRRSGRIGNNKILIVIPCLIGEFAAATPALFDFIQRNSDKQIDLLVVPSLKNLAQRILGAGDIFVAASVHKRKSEILFPSQSIGSYEKIIVLRMSHEAYRIVKNTECAELKTALPRALLYILHLGACLIAGRAPKSWRTFNFEVLGGKDREIPFEEIFHLEKEDFERLNQFSSHNDPKNKIILHFGTNWNMKHWALEKWVQLITQISKIDRFVFMCVGGKDSEADFEYISSRLDFPIESYIDKIDILDLLLLMRTANYFIGIDSGPANLAHLADLRSITIYGPGPHLFFPTNPGDIAIDKSHGRGLFQLYFSASKKIIDKIQVDEVFVAFKKLYANK